MVNWGTPRLLPPVTGDRTRPTDWVLSSAYRDQHGRHWTVGDVLAVFRKDHPGDKPNLAGFQQLVHALGLHVSRSWQPASRYWTFQAIEGGGVALLASALLLVVVWRVRKGVL